MNKNILITLPYSYSYRNIVLTGVLEQLLERGCKVMVVLPKELCNEPPILTLMDRFPLQLRVSELIRPSAYTISNVLFLLCASLMQKAQGTYSYKIKQRNSKYLGWKSFFKLRLLPIFLPKNKRVFLFLRWLLIKSLYNENVLNTIKEFGPDVIFSTLNNKVNEYYYLAFGYENNINTVSLVHSWDVITTKGSFVLPTDSVLVWNKINELEYKFFVDSFFNSNSSVYKVGIPQFDVYKEHVNKTSLLSVKEKLGIPIDKQVVVYTTAVERLYPNEKLIVEKLMNDFERGRFPGKFLYVRLHPQESSSLYKNLPRNGNSFKLNIPEHNLAQIEDSVKFNSDTLLKLFDDLFVADVVVNMASSITLDSSALNKPVINLAFDHINKPNESFYQSVERFYYTDHFSKIIGAHQSSVASSYSDLCDYIDNISEQCSQSTKTLRDAYIFDFGNGVNNIVSRII
ncbi:CDP-glycerol glycerophosphotransferase family protein [Vibrio sp. Isolate25]|uniref:CDP-glycerol glycerophosphotransferase family protein n=1 Tax=Vibrio sp. Isolate25 TaxID=2908535 RepID=UPI001EFE3A69|nr:CDP-glycerol glycerophosphotransferase family protein [Vibrio sp. Isolate25]MCG9597827.1 CDP-glycerol glycerophosphotransferase family protein [Vibrio sp. Isolate25]